MLRILFTHPNQKLSAIYLRHLGDHFDVDVSHDGLMALRKFKLNAPAAVISDYNLPLLSGLSLLRYVRRQPEFEAIPFIFLTDHADNSHALSFGANDWIDYRSIHPDYLVARIYHHLKLNRHLLKKGIRNGL
jgi:DNA-binding response OmpR family regulator